MRTGTPKEIEAAVFAYKGQACRYGADWAETQDSLWDAWNNCEDSNIILWTLREIGHGRHPEEIDKLRAVCKNRLMAYWDSTNRWIQAARRRWQNWQYDDSATYALKICYCIVKGSPLPLAEKKRQTLLLKEQIKNPFQKKED